MSIIKKIIRKLSSTSSTSSKENKKFYLLDNDAYSNYDVGVGSYGNPRIQDWKDGSTLTIGNYCSFAGNVVILLGGEHHSEWLTTYPFSTLDIENSECQDIDHKSKGNVVIGHDVWVGMKVTILSGVTIGNGAIIGAGSVVTKDVPSYSIYAGNPAKLLRYRFEKETIDKLNKIEWWHWDKSRIVKNYPLLLSNKIDEFIKNNSQ